MQKFFSETVGFGRYAAKTIGEVFACDRHYFDLILHRNAGFKNRYVKAFGSWIASLKKAGATTEDIRRERIMAAVAVMGDKKVQELFNGVLKYIYEQCLPCNIPAQISFKETLTDTPPDELVGSLDIITRFWGRVAFPEV